MSFHLDDMDELRSALETLRDRGVKLGDPGDEIGPEAEGSPHLGLWFHDPDGYRWDTPRLSRTACSRRSTRHCRS
jgi:hypothetical protein